MKKLIFFTVLGIAIITAFKIFFYILEGTLNTPFENGYLLGLGSLFCITSVTSYFLAKKAFKG